MRVKTLVFLTALAAPLMAASPAKVKPKAAIVVMDFEAAMNADGKEWWTACDAFGTGTKLEPQPFVAEKGGSPKSKGHCAHIHGRMGEAKEPWPWASMGIGLASPELSAYKAVTFYAKGDGRKYRFQLVRTAIKDFAHYHVEFTAPKKWTLITVPLQSLEQTPWGERVPKTFNDVEMLQYMPVANGEDFDLYVDDLTLIP